MAEEKTETEILFPEEEVAGEKVRPWDFGKLAQMAPYVIPMAKKMNEMGLTRDNMQQKLTEDLVPLLLPFSVPIVARTLGKDEAEVSKWHPSKGGFVFMVILNQNMESIKNFFGLRILTGEDQNKTG
jgi:hypothetical protein